MTDEIGLGHNSQYEGHIRDYMRGIMRRARQSSEYVGLYGNKRSPLRCSSSIGFSSDKDLRCEYSINDYTQRPRASDRPNGGGGRDPGSAQFRDLIDTLSLVEMGPPRPTIYVERTVFIVKTRPFFMLSGVTCRLPISGSVCPPPTLIRPHTHHMVSKGR